MSSVCPHCGGQDIEIDAARGDTVCIRCGSVLSEHGIVNEVQFLENSRGGSSTVGQFVATDSISKRPSLRGYHGSFGRESKEITLSNARRKISAVSQQLRLSHHSVETAFNFFKLALSKGLTKGRKSSHVIGACVYMNCRIESTAHMLIDVSDALQIDVFELGRVYLRLSTGLCINIPAMDPCLYIVRFAHKLSFGEKTHEVSETALRLVRRMKRDWIHVGRRPSGVCGAALIIAARLHNYNRTLQDIIKVVKVHETTLRKRLAEFGDTPSSALTLDEFMNADLEMGEEEDPPSFKAARKKEEIMKLLDQQENLDTEFLELQTEIEKHMNERRSKLRGIWAKYAKEELETTRDSEGYEANQFITEATLQTIKECIPDDINDCDKSVSTNSHYLRPSAESLGITDSIEECMEIKPTPPEPEESGVLDLTDIDDNEIDTYIMSPREIKLKTKLWMDLNKQYLQEMEEKERLKKENEDQEKEEKKKRRKPYKRKQKSVGPANSAGEAIEKMLQERKISNKINYDVLKNLNGESDVDSNTSEDRKPIKIVKYTPCETHEPIQSILRSLAEKSQAKYE